METTRTVIDRELTMAEALILHRLTEDGYTITDKVFHSETEFDLSFEGTHRYWMNATTYTVVGVPGVQHIEEGWQTTKFSAWLPLQILHDAPWSDDPIAGLSDYPDMAYDGDWSAIRDTEEEGVWEMLAVVIRS
jgi:hypothetical protein